MTAIDSNDDVERNGDPWTDGRLDGRPTDESTANMTFELLRDWRTRTTVAHLVENDAETVSFEELRDRLAAADPAAAVDPLATRRRATIALHHVVLPRLDDEGIADYDARSGTVRYWSNPEVEDVLARVDDDDSPEEFENLDHSTSLDVWFDLFSHPHRRVVLDALQTAGGTASLGNLASELVRRENDDVPEVADEKESPRGGASAETDGGSAESYRKAYLSLYHEHMPKLAAADVVEHDSRADVVRLTRHGDEFKRYHDAIDAES